MPIMLVMLVARGVAGGAQPTATLVRAPVPITRGQKNALTTMSTIRSPDLMLLVVVRGTVRCPAAVETRVIQRFSDGSVLDYDYIRYHIPFYIQIIITYNFTYK